LELENVILINDFGYVNGGQSKVAIESALLLAETDIDVVFFAACGPVDERLEQAGVKVICLNQHDILGNPNRVDAAITGIWNKKAAIALRDLLRSFNPARTVVHCHGFAKALSPSIWPVLGDGEHRSFYTMHEYFLACPNGGFFDFQQRKICTRKPLGFQCITANCDQRSYSHKSWRLLRQTVGQLFAGYRKRPVELIFISEIQRKAIQPYLGQAGGLHYLPNPVDLDSIERVDARKNEVFLFVGRLGPEKGAVEFAQAAVNVGVKAVFVGDGDEREKIESLSPDIEVTGWLGGAEVDSWLAKARCLVFPSLWYECMPLVPLEALARGVPVVAGSWTAGSDYIEDNKNGLILSEPGSSSIESALRELTSDDHPVFESAKFVSADLNRENHLRKLLALYGSPANSVIPAARSMA
jgi:glycosyltransferase involved in cell wall biosynthesis